jgi:hypothetical protein
VKLEYTEISVQALIREAQRDRSLALPEFQRPYVWDENDVAEMLRTVINDWPAGTILLISSKELIGRFAFHALRGAPPDVTIESVKSLVLDGQQRLTSVFQALTNNHEKFVFFVDMRRVHERNRFDDEALLWKKHEDYPQPQDAADALLVGIHELYNDRAFGDWLDRIDPALKDRMELLFDDHLWALREYKFPANTLPADLEFRSLVRIFDKLNRLGEALETFDLLVALLLPDGFKLRERADEANTVFAGISEKFKVNPIELTKLVALEEHLKQKTAKAANDVNEIKVHGIREDDVLDLVDYDASLITTKWDDAVLHYADALAFVREHCGAVTPNLLPQDALLLALATALAAPNARDGFHNDLRRWIWASYFTQAYAQGANTRAVTDAEELLKWCEDDEKLPSAISQLQTRPDLVGERLRDSRRGNKTFERGLMALIVSDGANDWLRPRVGEQQELRLHAGAIDFHHVFPDGYLTARGKPTEMMVNFTPLKASSNRSLGKDAPSTVVTDGRFDADALVVHRIDADALRADRVEDYLSKRIPQLAGMIASAVAIPEVAANA